MSSSDAAPRGATAFPGKTLLKGPSNKRFEAVFSQGRRVGGPILRMVALQPGSGLVGIATAKKIGGKPQRNHAKRRVRAAVQLNPEPPDPRLDYVIVVSESGARASFERIQGEVRRLLAEAVGRWADELESS
jgi:ribonuclease P protein component